MEMLKNVSNANIHDSEFHHVGRDYVQTTINSTSVYGNLESPAPKFLDLLPHIDCERKHNFVRSSIRTRPTVGQWLLDSETYKIWKSGGGGSSTRLLWLNGIPGVGKTVICSRVIDDLRDNQTHPVAFFYCGEGDTSTKCDSKNILASLLRQLLNYTPLDHSKFSLILKRYQRSEEVNDPTLTTFIQEVSNLYEKTFIVIDALDECCNLETMLPEFGILARKLCIFISSRDHADIRTTFKRHAQIRVCEDDIVEDIFQYVEQEVNSIKIQNIKLRNSVINNLIIGAQGSFLWPVCQIQRLRKAKRNKEMEDILASIPQGMRTAIEKSLKTIDSKENAEILCSALQLVVFALRPISLQALAEVMGTLEMKDMWDPDLITREPRGLVDDFAGLLICVSGKERNRYESCWSTGFGDDDIVVPFHQCVKEYLLADPVMLPSLSDLKKYSLYPPSTSHDSIAKLCLKYQNLVFKHAHSLDLEPAHYPFAEYALREWLPHNIASGKKIDDLQNHGIVSTREEIIKGRLNNPTPNLTRTGFESKVQRKRWPNKTKLMAEDNTGLSLLHIAMKNSATIEDVNRLLEEGADVNQLSEDFHSATVLHFAIIYHQEPMAIIKRLLDAGADVNATAKGGVTALHILLQWHSAEHALSYLDPLLEHGANTNATDDKLHTPFHVLAQHAQLSDFVEPIVELLLKHKANIDARDGEGRTPLHWAAQSGYVPLVSSLLANGAAVDAVDNSFHTPLSLVAKFIDSIPHQLVIEQLRGHGANCNLARQDVYIIDTSKRYYIRNRATSRVWSLHAANNKEYHVNCSQIFVWGTAHCQWKFSRTGEDQSIMIEACQASSAGYYKVTDRLDTTYLSQNAGRFHFIPVKGRVGCYFIAANVDLQVVTDRKEETKAPMDTKAVVWNDPYQMWQLLEVDMGTSAAQLDIPEVIVLDKVISKFGVVMERRQWLGCPLPKANMNYNKDLKCRIRNRLSRRVLTYVSIPNQSEFRVEHQSNYGNNTLWEIYTQKRPPPGIAIQAPFNYSFLCITEDLQCVVGEANATNVIYLIQVPDNPNWHFIVVNTRYDPPLVITDAGGDNGFKSPAVLALDDKTQMWEMMETL